MRADLALSRDTSESEHTLARAGGPGGKGGAVFVTADADVTISGTYFDGNYAVSEANDVYDQGYLTCPSDCPDRETGTCTPMSSTDCAAYGTDCTCYSCACSSGLAATPGRLGSG